MNALTHDIDTRSYNHFALAMNRGALKNAGDEADCWNIATLLPADQAAGILASSLRHYLNDYYDGNPPANGSISCIGPDGDRLWREQHHPFSRGPEYRVTIFAGEYLRKRYPDANLAQIERSLIKDPDTGPVVIVRAHGTTPRFDTTGLNLRPAS